MNDRNSKSNRSDAQNAASRANGAKSRGPITPEGKARSSQNALKHGLRSRRVVLVNESQEQYDALLASYRAEWRPIGATENDLLVQMVNASWQLRRVETLEAATLDSEMFILKPDHDQTYTVSTPALRQAGAVMAMAVHNPIALDYLRRAHTSFSRTYDRALKGLIKVQTMRFGHAPILAPVETETHPATKEPAAPPPATLPNYPEPEVFAWISQFIPSANRRSTNHATWLDPDEVENLTPAA